MTLIGYNSNLDQNHPWETSSEPNTHVFRLVTFFRFIRYDQCTSTLRIAFISPELLWFIFPTVTVSTRPHSRYIHLSGLNIIHLEETGQLRYTQRWNYSGHIKLLRILLTDHPNITMTTRLRNSFTLLLTLYNAMFTTASDWAATIASKRKPKI